MYKRSLSRYWSTFLVSLWSCVISSLLLLFFFSFLHHSTPPPLHPFNSTPPQVLVQHDTAPSAIVSILLLRRDAHTVRSSW